MPPARRFRPFLIVFTVLCVVSLVVVLFDEFGNYGWVNRLVTIGHSLGRLFFTSVAFTFVLVEGYDMIWSWIRKQEIEEARRDERAVVLEAVRAKKDGETHEEAIDRVKAERATRP